MKKFLTVLLVIAVMFTFSFGSAFAAVPNYDQSLATRNYELAMAAVQKAGSVTVEDGSGNNYVVKYATLNAHSAELLEAVLDYDKNGAAADYVKDAAGIKAVLEAAAYAELKMTVVDAQYAADKADAIAILNGLDVSEYSTANMPEADTDGCKTYVEHVQYLINDAVKEINKATFTTDSTIENYKDAKDIIDGYFGAYTGGAVAGTILVAEKGYMANTTPVGLGVYELNKDYATNSTTLAKYTTSWVDAQGTISEANVAAVKAQIASEYAAFVATHTTAADKSYAANVKKVLDFLAEQKIALINDAAAAAGATAYSWYFNTGNIAAATIANAIASVEAFEAEAARLAAETDAKGALVRDAKDVADYVTEGTINAYETAVAFRTVAGGTISACLTKITNLYASLDDAKLAYTKKLRETFVAEFLEAAEDYYYPTELAKVKALTDEYLEKVNATTDISKLAGYDTAYFGNTLKNIADADYEVTTGSIAAIDKYSVIDGKSTALKTTVEKYVALENDQITKADNKYDTSGSYAKLHAEIEALVGNSSARTTKEIAALSEQAIALIKTLPTVGAVAAAKEAADDAVTALPNTVKVADKALIDAAIAAVDAYEDMTAQDYPNKATTLDVAVTKYAYAYNNEMTAKVKAVNTQDKAALQGLIDEIDAFVADYDNAAVFSGNKGQLKNYLADIQKAEITKVSTAITAIPVMPNLINSNKAKVEAARALYDAYVAGYTDYTDWDYNYAVNPATITDGFAADDADYSALVKAETLLGLNTEDPALSVESLKITASSTAAKGSITVKWTVTGDTSAVEGYEIWKSTKRSSGFSKAFTQKATKKTYKNTKGLKKGTRYYYKVRAIAYTADGTKVKSDWSNKAYRIAK